MSQACVRCGTNPAKGFAMLGGERLCHGDSDPEPTCYQQAQWHLSTGTAVQEYADLFRAMTGYQGEISSVQVIDMTEPGPQQCSGAVHAGLSAPQRCAYPEGHEGACEA